MITVIDNGLSIRLLYDNIEVLNHGEQFPFVKYLKGETVYSTKKTTMKATYDIDGEFVMDCKVKSSSVKSANIKFSGYDDAVLTLNAVEEHDCLKLHFTTQRFQSVRFSFISNPFERILVGGEDMKGKRFTNVQPTEVSAALIHKSFIANLFKQDNPLAEVATFDTHPQFVTEKGLRYVFETMRLAEFDFTAKNTASVIFESCPVTITVIKDNSLKG